MPASRAASADHEAINRRPVERERLQIRMVPYSPPRISSDGSPSSLPASCVEDSPTTPSRRNPKEPNETAYALEFQSHSDHLALPDTNSAVNVTSGGQGRPNWISSTPSPTASRPPSSRRPTRIISVNSDKTFSLLPQAYSPSLATESMKSPRRSSTAPSTSLDYSGSIAVDDEPPDSPLTTLAEQSQRSSSERSLARLESKQSIGPSSSWSNDFVGGLRRVASSIGEDRQNEVPRSLMPTSSNAGERSIFEADVSTAQPTSITPKASFQSSQSESSASHTANFKTYAWGSPGSALPYSDNEGSGQTEDMHRSPTQPNCEVIGESESDLSGNEELRPRTEDSNSNYVVHRHMPSSPARSSENGRLEQLHNEYSRESLVVAPLRTGRRVFSDQMFLSKQRSRESVRTGSLTSISSAFIEEATRNLFAKSPSIRVPFGANTRNASRENVSVSAGSRNLSSANHKWSTALSTVMSESDRDSVGTSMSLYRQGTFERRSSYGIHGRNVTRTSPGVDGWMTETGSDMEMLTNKHTPDRDVIGRNVRLIRDHDEHGDGLAELDELHRRSSRTRLHSFLSSYPSDRNLRSAGSSQSDSQSRSYIPMWARLYYGSGERRFLAVQQSSDSLFSEYIASSHHSPAMSRSPSAECFSPELHHPRHRPRNVPSRQGAQHSRPHSTNDISYPPLAIVRQIKKQTSSLWSPHLRRDHRASRYSLWQPPPSFWAAKEEMPRKHNMQTVLFVLGFVFPLAWMVASFLPLPRAASFGMSQPDYSTSGLDLEKVASHAAAGGRTDLSSQRARWWRNLNRGMSVFGLLMIAAVIALIVTGTRQR